MVQSVPMVIALHVNMKEVFLSRKGLWRLTNSMMMVILSNILQQEVWVDIMMMEKKQEISSMNSLKCN